MSTPSYEGKPSPTAPDNWTIMLYIAADDVLANFAVDSLKQLNRSVSGHAHATGESRLTVAANFAFPMGTTKSGSPSANPREEDSPRLYIFKEPSGKPDAENKFLRLPPADKPKSPAGAGMSEKANLSEKEALKEFLERVFADPECNQSQRYALILWGHGPELLFQPPPVNPSNGDRTSLYLTPEDLREALADSKPPGRKRLDIIGFDACFMSMFEMACELEGLADYMVASQDEVPDSSFPYDCLVELFRRSGNQPATLLAEGVKAYVETYQDYIFTLGTKINPVTLSVLQLDKSGALQYAVRLLSCELLKAKDDPELQCLLIEARKESQDYAGGLYVDLHEFCEKLSGQLTAFEQKKQKELNKLAEKLVELKQEKQLTAFEEKKQKELIKLAEKLVELKQGEFDKQMTWITGIRSACGRTACEGVLKELNTPAEGHPPGDSLILVNGSVNIPEKGDPFVQVNGKKDPETLTEPNSTRNHGISIYLPYLTEDQFAQVRRPLVKGGHGTGGAKGFSEVLDGAATEYLMCARRDLILDTESYYERLKMAETTHWYDFITELWTRALIKKVPAELDEHYSAQQSWINVSRKPIIAESCKPPESA